MAQDLVYIIPRFEVVIASKRRSSLIKTFEDLVMLLIKRNAIDPSNKSTWSTLNEVCTDFGKVFCDSSKQLSTNSEMRVPSTSYLNVNGNAILKMTFLFSLMIIGCHQCYIQACPQISYWFATYCTYGSDLGFGDSSLQQLDPLGMHLQHIFCYQ